MVDQHEHIMCLSETQQTHCPVLLQKFQSTTLDIITHNDIQGALYLFPLCILFISMKASNMTARIGHVMSELRYCSPPRP